MKNNNVKSRLKKSGKGNKKNNQRVDPVLTMEVYGFITRGNDDCIIIRNTLAKKSTIVN
jgi:hypothetical protein